MNDLPSKPMSPSTKTAGDKENRRQRRRREKGKSTDTPEASGSSTPKEKPQKNRKPSSSKAADSFLSTAEDTKFEEGEDFIPFTFSEAPDSEADIHRRINGQERTRERDQERSNKGKGKARDDTPPRSELTERDQTPPARTKEREWDRGKARERSREREKDKDVGESGHKRKYEMVFDPSDGYANKKQRTDASSRKAPWVNHLDLDSCNNVAEMLHREVEAFVNWISPSPVEDEVRGLVVSLISKYITATFPDARVLPFGSYQTKLYLPLGDIDLVILSDSMAYSDKVTVLHALANTLKRSGITSRVTIIAKAKVPIVKFVTTHGRFNVDISINQANGVVGGEMVIGFLRDMHGNGGKGSMALRSLVMIAKAFLSQRSMNEVYTGGLGSYSIVCLAVSFLQMHPKIRRGEIDAEKNLGVLVMEFFELYGCYFNYEEVGISVRDGGTYFSKRQRGWYDYYKGNLLSIEDPADPSNDISKGSYGFQKVRTTFAGAHGILTATAYLRAGMISARRSGRSVHLRDHYAPEDMSILSSVMGITQETINHRRLVQEVYDRRILHNLVGVNPKPTVVRIKGAAGKSAATGKGPSGSMGANSVRLAWQEAENDVNANDSNAARRRGRELGADDEEEGRYDIVRQPTNKRRKMGHPQASHMVFTTDEEEDELVARTNSSGEEDGEYASDGDREGLLISRDSKVEKRRSYWLSKGIGISGNGDDSS